MTHDELVKEAEQLGISLRQDPQRTYTSDTEARFLEHVCEVFREAFTSALNEQGVIPITHEDKADAKDGDICLAQMDGGVGFSKWIREKGTLTRTDHVAIPYKQVVWKATVAQMLRRIAERVPATAASLSELLTAIDGRAEQ